MNIILWIIFGAIAGWVASLIVGRNARIGALANIVVGIVGALMGGLLMNALGAPGVTGFNLYSLIVAILGATVLLFLVGLFRRSSANTPIRSYPEKRSSTPPMAQPKVEPRSSAPSYEPKLDAPKIETQNRSTSWTSQVSSRETKPQNETDNVVSNPASKFEAPQRNAQSPSTPSASKSAAPKIQPKKELGNVPKRSASKARIGVIFISYRRTDSTHVAGRIYDRLVGAFGKASVFKDVDSIPLGLDFKEYLDEKVGQCEVLLALIGDRWIDAKDEVGNRRLDDPTDFVRIEIESALARNIPVIPLLVGASPMPPAKELPDSLRKLVFRNGIPIRPDPDFHRDMDRLISALERYV